jgi:hypothetical protein
MRGDLGTFSVVEILQLIGMQDKSGVLRVRSRGRSAVLFFDSGKVISARDRRQGLRSPFLSYLQENSVITMEDLNRVLEAGRNEGGDLVEVLLKEKVVDEATLGKMLSRYTLQTLENVIKWEVGTFEFSASTDGLPEKGLTKPLRLEAVLMEALRRKDEVEEIRKFLPSFDTRIKVSDHNPSELPLEDRDFEILGLVNGRRTIDEIIEESHADEIETLDILERLFALGIVTIAEKPVESVTPLRSLVLAAAIVGISLLLRLTVLSPPPPNARPLTRLRNEIDQFVEAREVDNLRFALEVYHTIRGNYPAHLEDLVASGLVEDEATRNRYRKTYAYIYFPSEGRYVLSP